MSNILLTSYCNRNCKYCFAKETIEPEHRRGPLNMSAEAFGKCLDWAKRSRLDALSVLGGEPTLHPSFVDFLTEAEARGSFSHVKVFTNGLMPDPVIAHLSGCAPQRPALILNVNEPAEYSASEWQRIEGTLAALGNRIALGFNLYRAEGDLGFLLDLYRRYGLLPHVRFGMAQPILGMDNQYLPVEEFPAIAAKMVAIAREWTPAGLYFSFDCGFPFCMFSLDQHRELLRCGIAFRSVCDPIVDIGTDLRVWRCFPHSVCGKQSLDQFEVRDDAVRHFRKADSAFRAFGIYDRCRDCVYRKQGMCSGGCLARTMRLFHWTGTMHPLGEAVDNTGDRSGPDRGAARCS